MMTPIAISPELTLSWAFDSRAFRPAGGGADSAVFAIMAREMSSNSERSIGGMPSGDSNLPVCVIDRRFQALGKLSNVPGDAAWLLQTIGIRNYRQARLEASSYHCSCLHLWLPWRLQCCGAFAIRRRCGPATQSARRSHRPDAADHRSRHGDDGRIRVALSPVKCRGGLRAGLEPLDLSRTDDLVSAAPDHHLPRRHYLGEHAFARSLPAAGPDCRRSAGARGHPAAAGRGGCARLEMALHLSRLRHCIGQ